MNTPQAIPSELLHVDELYRDRAHLIALAALHYPAYLSYSDPAQPDWPVVTIDTPEGQLTWHVAPADLDLFPHVRAVPPAGAREAYDGHTTADKQARIRDLIGRYPAHPDRMIPNPPVSWFTPDPAPASPPAQGLPELPESPDQAAPSSAPPASPAPPADPAF